jgi:predicted DNA binding CopG/RHH family protein
MAARARQTKIQPPPFRSDEEERAFWETHKPGDYLASTRPIKVQVSRRIRERVRERKQNLIVCMKPFRAQEIKALAEERGLPYQTLMRMWIFERLRREKVG